MHILLVNDDGINAPGIRALAKALSKEHRITVSAPMEERSAVGHGLTVRVPLFTEKREVPGAQAAYAVSGTPAPAETPVSTFEIQLSEQPKSIN